MIGLDTNVVIRYLTQDDPRQAQLANRLFERTLSPGKPGFISLAVLCEIVWVLADSYSMDQAGIRAVIEGLLGSRQLQVESKDLVWKALRTLPPRQRAVLILHELDEVGIGDVARMLGVSQVTVRWHLSMGRRALARTIGKNSHA